MFAKEWNISTSACFYANTPKLNELTDLRTFYLAKFPVIKSISLLIYLGISK